MDLVVTTNEWNEDDDPADALVVSSGKSVAENDPAADPEVDADGSSELHDDTEDADNDAASVSRVPSLYRKIKEQLEEHPPLSAEEERAVTQKWFHKDFERWQEIMIMSCCRFVYKTVSKYRWVVATKGVSLEDLYQAGLAGVSDAAKRYDPASGTRFISFAGSCVLRYIREYIDPGLASAKMMYKTSAILDKPIDGNDSDSESAGNFLVLHSAPAGEEIVKASTPGKSLDEGAFANFCQRILDDWIATDCKLRPDDVRIVFESVFIKGYTLELTGSIMNKTRERARQVVCAISDMFKSHFTRNPRLWVDWKDSRNGLIKVKKDHTKLTLNLPTCTLKPKDTDRAGCKTSSEREKRELREERDNSFPVIKVYKSNSHYLVANYDKMSCKSRQRKPKDLVTHFRPFYGNFYSHWSRYHRGQATPEMDERMYNIHIACGNLSRKTNVIIKENTYE